MENHIGNNIKNIAEAKGLSVQEVAYRWKKSPQAVYDLHVKQFPKADVIIEMSRILNVSALEILGIQEYLPNTLQENDLNSSIVSDLRKQLEVKDKQIEFLQRMIEKLEDASKTHHNH